MSTKATSIDLRLQTLTRAMQEYALSCSAPEQSRYAASSATLVNLEHQKLSRAIDSGRNVDVAWALRSVADMMKGLIDIGSNLDQYAPDLWAEASSIAGDAHSAEVSMRAA